MMEDGPFKLIEDVITSVGIDEKVIKLQKNPSAAIITYANASYHMLQVLRKVEEKKQDGLAVLDEHMNKDTKEATSDVI